jgi:hypothetical protein
MLVIYNLFQTIGYYGFSSWVPTLLISQGVEVTKSLTYTFIIAVAAPIGPLIGMFFADHFERKWQIAWAAAGIAVFGLLFAKQTGAIGVILCGLLITLCNNWMSFSFHAYQAELYPTRIRAQAVGFVYSWSRFSAIFRFHHRLLPRPLRHDRRLQFHRRRHGHRVHRDRRIWAGGHQSPARSHCGVAQGSFRLNRQL